VSATLVAPGTAPTAPVAPARFPAPIVSAAQVLRLQRTVGNAAVGGLLAARPVQPRLARFEGPEHRRLGDSTGADVDLGDGVVLSWGQIVAIAGDEFGSVDELQAAAASPAGRARILAALQHDQTDDPMSALWSDEPSDDAKAAQKSEFLRLAAENASHFAEGGALQAWQAHHHRAIVVAVEAGLARDSAAIQKAYLIEAFGEHFLTDMYSAGHMRTPRRAIMDWYTTVFAPRVADAMLASIKGRVTAAAVEQASEQLPFYVSNADIRAKIAPIVSAKIDTELNAKLKGTTFTHALGIGIAGAISGMLHDKEGSDGVLVASDDHPDPWTAYGDGALEHSGPSAEQGRLAIAAAKSEVEQAFLIGEAGAGEREAAPGAPPSRVQFAFDSSMLEGANATSARASTAYMRLHADVAVDLIGHTDPIGSDLHNDGLGLRRAQEVERVLLAGGVEPSRVRAMSAGKHQLLTKDPKRYRLNRRTEFIWRSDPAAPHAGDSEDEAATRTALEQADSDFGAGYPTVTRYVPRPVEERGGAGNAALPDWHWGRLDAATRDAVDAWIRANAGSDLNDALATMELTDIIEHVKEGPVDQDVTIRPRPIIERLAEDFLKAPTATLGDLAGEVPGP
jgi:outer membrane protein OmpA-like peptidoglycan-associated protein